MTPYPFSKIESAKKRALRRSEKRAENAELSGKAPGKRVKRKKSPSLSKLKKLLWHEISLLVRSWSPTCVVPGCVNPTQDACHIVPSNDGAATRFFLPNLYPGCKPHNTAEHHQRGSWVYKHREMFGDDFVDALYAFSETVFQIKKWWVLEQTERVRKLRGENEKVGIHTN